MNFGIENTKYELKGLTKFKKQLKKIVKQGKNINKLIDVLKVLANGEILESKYKDHAIINDKYYKDCRECHIGYWYIITIIILVSTGSHSDLF